IIVRRSAGLLGARLRDDGGAEIAGRSRGNPRIANRLLRRVRDYAEVRADGVITRDIARAALELAEGEVEAPGRLGRRVRGSLSGALWLGGIWGAGNHGPVSTATASSFLNAAGRMGG